MAFAQLYDNTLTLLSGVSILQCAFYCAFFCLLAATGGVVNTFIDAISGFFGKKNLLNKVACQSSQSVIACLLLYLVFLGTLIPLPGGENPAAFIAPYCAEMVPLLPFILVCAILLTVLWSKIPNNILTYLFTLIAAAVLFVQAGWWIITDYAPFKPIQFDELLLPVAERIFETFDVSLHSDLLIIAGVMLLTACTVASMVMMIWLIIRRDWDDFGRDYYTFAMRRAARRSLFFLLLTTAAACYSNWQFNATLPEGFFVTYGLLLALASVILVVVSIMLIVISASATPMRCKPAAIASLALYALVFFIQLIMFDFTPNLV